ncbi:agmatinase family protein [Prosthecochloris marina]|nr:agmatinase family protein [Prosthecochloris marina]
MGKLIMGLKDLSSLVTPNNILATGGVRLVPDDSVTFIAEIVRPWGTVSDAEVGLLGVPFDGCVSYRPGTRFGPDSIRQALKLGTTYSVALDQDFSGLHLVDCGDVIASNVIKDMHDRVESVMSILFENRIFPLTIGGDHSISYPCIRALSRKNRGTRVGVIDFDAHFDSRKALPGREHSGMWVEQIQSMDGLPVAAANIVQIGIGDFAYSREYRNSILNHGGSFYTPQDIRNKGLETVVDKAVEQATRGVEALYVTVDIDCIQQAYAPGTSVPNPVGLSPWDLLAALDRISVHPLFSGFDLVEVAPPLDIDGMTSRLGAEIIRRVLCGLSLRFR